MAIFRMFVAKLLTGYLQSSTGAVCWAYFIKKYNAAFHQKHILYGSEHKLKEQTWSITVTITACEGNIELINMEKTLIDQGFCVEYGR